MQTSTLPARRSRSSSSSGRDSAAPLPTPADESSRATVAPENRPQILAPDFTNEEISRRAYARWENSDRAPGRDQEHWFAAEEELRRASGSVPPAGLDGNGSVRVG
jgi:hypothetical protein